MDPDVIQWLFAVIASLQLQVGSPDFEANAALAVRARRQLADLQQDQPRP